MESLKGKVVLITGASSGIGAGTAQEFAKYGCNLILTGRDSDRLQQVAAMCMMSPGQPEVFTVTGELTKDGDVNNIVESGVAKFGSIDILINNAGTAVMNNFQDSTIEDFDLMYDVNFRSVLRITRLCLPYIIESKGNIVNVSSIFADSPAYFMCPYAISKAALSHFTRCLAIELAPKHVRVNAVSPGAIPTELLFRINQAVSPEEKAELLKKFSRQYPMERTGKVDEVGKAIVFLASDAASFTTGHVFPVDGGFVISLPSQL